MSNLTAAFDEAVSAGDLHPLTTEVGVLTTRIMQNLTAAAATANATIDDRVAANKAQFLLYDILIPSIAVVVMIMNLAVIVSSGLILKKGQQPKSTYLFLGNVAMTDFITGLALILGQTLPKQHRDHYLCSFEIGLIVASTLASVYSVGLIAIDRFLYILHGMKYQKWVYPTRARLLIAFTWIIGCVIGFMPVFGWYSDTENGKICWFIRLAPKELIVLTVSLGMIPIFIVIFLYSIILYHALRKIMQLQQIGDSSVHESANTKNLRMFRGGAPTAMDDKPSKEEETKKSWFVMIFKKPPSTSVKTPKKWKAIKVVLFTTLSFVITWSPYFVVSLIYVYTCDKTNWDSKRCKNISLLVASPLAILGFVNSLMNPIIYAWWHKGFRTYVKKRVSTIIMRTRGRHQVNQSASKTTSRKTSSTSTPANGPATSSIPDVQPNT